MSRSTILSTLIVSGFSLSSTSCAMATQVAADQASRALEREIAERVDSGTEAGADAAEEAILGGDGASAGANSPGESGSDSDGSGPADSPAGGVHAVNAGSNYDYARGERPLLHEDYANDNLGDFPRGFELVEGTWDVVEIEGRRWLRGTGGRGSDFQVVLPEALPERFTIEYEIMYTHGNQVTIMATSPVEGDPASSDGTLVQVKGVASGAWIPASRRELFSLVSRDALSAPTPVEIMVDGAQMKVFVAGVRVANVPNAEVVRSDRLHFEDTYFSTPEAPVFIGAIRVDVGGLDL